MQTISNIHPAQCVTRLLMFSCDDCERVFQVLPYLSTHTLKHTTNIVMKTTCPTTKVCQLYGNCGSNNTVVLQSYISCFSYSLESQAGLVFIQEISTIFVKVELPFVEDPMHILDNKMLSMPLVAEILRLEFS